MYRKAKIKVERGGEIEVMFNPAEYNISSGTNYASINIPGMDGPITQYISGTQDTLTLQLMFNTFQPPKYDPRSRAVKEIPDSRMTDVSKYTSKIFDLTKISGSLHRPPICTFKWGALQFKGMVSDVSQKFTMFLGSGKAVRALVDVTFKSVMDADLSKKSSPFESPDRTKCRTLDESGSLWQMAFDEYGDCGKWKYIAAANGISNPLNIRPGTKILLPPLKP